MSSRQPADGSNNSGTAVQDRNQDPNATPNQSNQGNQQVQNPPNQGTTNTVDNPSNQGNNPRGTTYQQGPSNGYQTPQPANQTAQPAYRTAPANNAAYAQPMGYGTAMGGPSAGDLDRTRWGPIWAGFVSTIGIFLIVETFLIWLGVLGVAASSTGGVTMSRPWVSWIIAVVAFFIGGVVTAMTNPVRGGLANALNGFFVWALATTVMAAASIFGGGAIFGTLGSLVTHILAITGAHGHRVTTASLSSLKSAAGWAFWTLLSTAIAVGLGGLVAGFGQPVGRVEDVTGNYVQ